MPVWKTYHVVAGEFISETLPAERFFNVSGSADWFTPIENEFTLGQLIGYEITAPTIGNYSIVFTELVQDPDLPEGDLIEWTIELFVIADTLSLYNNCCGGMNIAWLNIQGGWQNYQFNGIKTYQVDIDSSRQFKTSGLIQKHSQIEGVYNGELISSGDIPRSHVDILDGLKYSIQAFLYNDDTGAWDIPILVDIGSFTKYKSRDKFFEVRLKFIYAEEILVQSQ